MISVDNAIQFEDYCHYQAIHPVQSLESKLFDAEFKKRMAEAMKKEKADPKKTLYINEDSGIVFTSKIHPH